MSLDAVAHDQIASVAHPALSAKVANVAEFINQRLNEIHSMCFVSEVRLTLVARLPSDPEADLIMTLDDPDEVIKALDRTRV